MNANDTTLLKAFLAVLPKTASLPIIVIWVVLDGG